MKRDLFIAYIALAAICVIWGTTYLALRIAVAEIPPFFFSAVRQIIAGGLLLTFMFGIRRKPFPKGKYLAQQAFNGFLMITLGNGLVAWGEMYISSGVAALICSMMPVWVILINVAIGSKEKLNALIISGVLIGMLGIMIVFGENLSEFTNPLYTYGIIFTFIAAMSWAAGSIYSKVIQPSPGAFINAGFQMLFGGIGLLALSFVIGEEMSFDFSGKGLGALIYLIIFGSIIAMTCYSYALSKLPVSLVSLYAYVNPLVAIVLGWLILDETLNLRTGIAFILTVLGIYLVNKGHKKNLDETHS